MWFFVDFAVICCENVFANIAVAPAEQNRLTSNYILSLQKQIW